MSRGRERSEKIEFLWMGVKNINFLYRILYICQIIIIYYNYSQDILNRGGKFKYRHKKYHQHYIFYVFPQKNIFFMGVRHLKVKCYLKNKYKNKYKNK